MPPWRLQSGSAFTPVFDLVVGRMRACVGSRAGVDVGILHHGKSTTCVQGLCVRVEVNMMAENRVHTYS